MYFQDLDFMVDPPSFLRSLKLVCHHIFHYTNSVPIAVA